MSKWTHQLHPCFFDPERVVLYKRKDKGDFWYVRIKRTTGGRYLKRSLKTPDLKEAHKAARKLWEDLITAERSGVVYGMTNFSTLFHRFCKVHTWKPDRRNRIEHVYTRYFGSYFGDRCVKTIDRDVYVAYLRWRYDFWTRKEEDGDRLPHFKRTHPSASTLRSERQILRQFLRWCETEKIISGAPDLPFDFDALRIPATTKKSRGLPIETKQYQRIIQKMRHYAGVNKWERGFNEGDPLRYIDTDRVTAWARLRLYYFVVLTGHLLLRQGTEATRLRWKDVKHRVHRSDARQRFAEVWVKAGKKGARDTPALCPEGRPYLQLLIWTQISRSFGIIDPDAHIFGALDGTHAPAHYLGRLHSRFLRDIGEQSHEEGTRITLYSYRHTAICRRITESGWDPLKVAGAANTSLMTISNSYAHAWKLANSEQFINVHRDAKMAEEIRGANAALYDSVNEKIRTLGV